LHLPSDDDDDDDDGDGDGNGVYFWAVVE